MSYTMPVSEFLAVQTACEGFRAENTQLRAVIKELTAEVAKIRNDIISARGVGLMGVDHSRFDQAAQAEIARLDALIERGAHR